MFEWSDVCNVTVHCVPAISKSLEPVTGQMSNTIAAKLTAVEGTLKENVIKVVKSKVCLIRFSHTASLAKPS